MSATSDLAARVEALAGAPVAELTAVGSQHRWRHLRGVLAGGRNVFVKAAGAGLGGVFEAEARGLRWLAQAGGVPVPAVLGWDDTMLVVDWVAAGAADAANAERFGAELAATHQAGSAGFGAPWPGFIAHLPLPNGGGAGIAWPAWYATARLAPYLRRAADAGALGRGDAALVEAVIDRIEDLAGPPEPPSRIHGDCWSGNVIWSPGGAVLVDPAAHGGHRETDLAMLALFGVPHLGRILGAYLEAAPLADGWRRRVPLHQLHPLLVHACLFGGGYAGAVADAARAALTA